MEKNPLNDILARTCTDRAFREQFIRNPEEVLSRAGIQVPEGVAIRVVENTDEVIHVVLPTDQKDQPAHWTLNERPAPGREVKAHDLTLLWTESGLSLIGRINTESALILRQELDRVKGNLYIDFSQVTFMSSAGLGAILAAQKRLVASHRELYLCEVAQSIRNVFALSGMEPFFQFINVDAGNWWMPFQ